MVNICLIFLLSFIAFSQQFLEVKKDYLKASLVINEAVSQSEIGINSSNTVDESDSESTVFYESNPAYVTGVENSNLYIQDGLIKKKEFLPDFGDKRRSSQEPSIGTADINVDDFIQLPDSQRI